MGNEVPPRSSSLLGLLIASTLGSFLKRLSELAQGPGTLGSALSTDHDHFPSLRHLISPRPSILVPTSPGRSGEDEWGQSL